MAENFLKNKTDNQVQEMQSCKQDEHKLTHTKIQHNENDKSQRERENSKGSKRKESYTTESQ